MTYKRCQQCKKTYKRLIDVFCITIQYKLTTYSC